MGRSLHSVIEEEDELLSEKDVLQLACRIVSVLMSSVQFLGLVHDLKLIPLSEQTVISFYFTVRCSAIYSFK